MPIAKDDTQSFCLGSIPRPNSIGIHQPVARRKGRANDLFEAAVEYGKSIGKLSRRKKFDTEPAVILQFSLLDRLCVEFGIGIEPEIATFSETEIHGMVAKEFERRAT